MYEERVTFHPIVQVAYLAGVAALVWGQLQAVPTLPWVAFVVGVPLIILPLMFGRLLIRMDAQTLFVEFGYLGWPIQKVPLANIERASVVTYKPIRNFGGWGIRAGKLTHLITFMPAVKLQQNFHVYLAEDLTAGEHARDHDEDIELVRMPLEEAVTKAFDGTIIHGPSIVSIAAAHRFVAGRS